jgi:lipopolysaccharide export system protein LptA
MNGFISIGSVGSTRPRGWKRAGGVETLLLLVWATLPASLGAIEVNDLAPQGEGLLGKSLQEEDWNRNAPVDIHSEEMTVDFEKRRIVFKGDVKVLQSDFSLTAGEVTAVFGESADDIKKIIAADDVKIQKADKMAWGQEAVYDREGATILLTGAPVLKQGRNFIKGEEIHFSLDDDRMEVKGSVEAEFLLSGQEEELGIRGQGSGVREPEGQGER